MALHLLPNLLDPKAEPSLNFVSGLFEVVNSLSGFFVEDPKEARQFLSHFDFKTLKEKPMVRIEENLDREILLPLEKGESWGVITDRGLPCLADPGAKIVALARQKNIKVYAYPGPCSFILALMLSGIECQSFQFQGYMPRVIDKTLRKKEVVQVFIETPYRTQKTLEALLAVLHDEDLLCLALDLTMPSQEVITQKVSLWKKNSKESSFHKRPCIFILKTF
ncbi:MAG: SAM-dependent methyltransferase [Verrucomicrobia bacterium]|nr:SAM-dependent methyltransferase [Verrucomicrobiota bacterium]